MNEITNRDVLLWLNSIYISNKTIENMFTHFENISDVWYLSAKEIMNIDWLKENVKERLITHRNYDYLEKLKYIINEKDINVITILDEEYPERLKNIFEPPKVLYCKGKMTDEDELAIAMVGSRKATAYGKWASEKISGELAKLGITVVSGLAKGIDTESHKGALKENGRTIAVLGSGIDNIYPRTNEQLFNEISHSGCIVTEYPMGAQPLASNFPQRNRIISGLSLGVIVIEAKERSGSLITVEHAIQQGKEVFAVPGNINSIYSVGTNKLIKDGAKIVTEVEDVLEEINELKAKIDIYNNNKKKNIDYSSLSETEMMIVKCISEGPIHCDSIVYNTGLNISIVNSTLTILEIKGIIKELQGKIYTLV